jgi:hypothetical protein
MSEILYDTDKLEKSAKTIEEELCQFEQFDKRYLLNTVDDLEKMYSESTNILKDSLVEMGDIDLAILSMALNKYSKTSAFTGIEMERAETEIGESFKGGG